MKSRIRQIFLFFVLFMLVVDGFSYAGLRMDFRLFHNPPAIAAFWGITLAIILILHLFGRVFLADNKPGFFSRFYVFTGIFLSVYVPKLFYMLFIMLELALKILVYPVLLIFSEPGSFGAFVAGGPLNIISMLILPLSLTAFLVVLSGMIFGRFNFRERRTDIPFNGLPVDFDGYRIVHISDLHLGSMYGKQEKLRKAVNMINRAEPDLVLFTGDLVNNLAAEAEGWTGLLSEIKAKQGKYSILGNHDYGEYYNWPDEASREANMQKLAEAHHDSGFELLLNRSVKIQRNGSKIALAGVENWGLPPFMQYGDLEGALKGVDKNEFTVLLSHDPSHWDAEILGNGVDLTLSGHTHGMQFGIRTRKIRWSPVQWKYPRWIGMYRQGQQFLHVNPGLGHIGYAGRIWIPPEISVLTLRRSG
jgi:predicted MPP superfamily phosphohydrolase